MHCGTLNPSDAAACAGCGADPSGGLTLTSLPAGTTLHHGQYVIEGLLGQGGFGVTYRALDRSLNARVALKEFYPNPGARRGPGGVVTHDSNYREVFEKLKQRFHHEAEALVPLRHPSIVRMFAVFEENGTAYLAMELLEGETLQARLDRAGRLDEVSTRAILSPLLGALDEIHGRGLLHRDIKPENIVLTPQGPVLIDFGTAREFTPGCTAATSAVLTPAYAPLEQYVASDLLGPPTDLYALAATIYHALTGRPPAPSAERASMTVLTPIWEVSPGVSVSLAGTIEAALSIKVSERPQTAGQMLALVNQPPTPPAPPSPTIPPPAPTIPPPAPVAPTVRYPAPPAEPETPYRPPRRGFPWGWTITGVVVMFLALKLMSGSPPAQPQAADLGPLAAQLEGFRSSFVDGAGSSSDSPSPAFVSIEAPGSIQAGEPFVLTVSARNLGTEALAGSISVSVDDPGPLDVARSTLASQSNLWRVEKVNPGRKVLVLGGVPAAQRATHWLFEGYSDAAHGGWPAGKEKLLALSLYPASSGVIRLFVRATASLGLGATAANHMSAPGESPQHDQQNFPVIPLSLTVNP